VKYRKHFWLFVFLAFIGFPLAVAAKLDKTNVSSDNVDKFNFVFSIKSGLACDGSLNPMKLIDGTIKSSDSVYVGDKPLTKIKAQAQSLRLITGHTAATLPKGSFELAIQHRFGALNSGAYNLYGLDNFNSMRIAADYGVFDRLTAGIGRSSFRKTYNGYIKWRFFGKPESKFNLTYLADMAIDARSRADWYLEPFFQSHRLFFTHQLIASWQVNNGLLLSLSPTIVHANLVSQHNYSNDMPVISGYIRQQIIPKFALTGEVSAMIPGILHVKPKNHATIGFGFEYFTPKHAFQINLTNSRALNEAYFLTDNPSSTLLGDFSLGFNLIRRW